MTSKQHRITPPPELFVEWIASALRKIDATIPKDDGGKTGLIAAEVAIQAARWGADQELEACVEHLKRIWSPGDTIDSLRAARRPKPPSLKEQALEALDRMDQLPTAEDQHIIRRALEQLDE